MVAELFVDLFHSVAFLTYIRTDAEQDVKCNISKKIFPAFQTVLRPCTIAGGSFP